MNNKVPLVKKTRISHEDLKSGYIYKTNGSINSLFIGHVSTLKLKPRMLIDENADLSLVTDADFLNKTKSVPITEKTRSFSDYRIITEYIEYGTLWFDFTSLTNWLLKHPDVLSEESIAEIMKRLEPNAISLYDYSIRSKVAFVEPFIDYKFDISFDKIYPSLREKAATNINRRHAYFEHFSTKRMSSKVATSKITLLANMTPLGSYPQINSCFNCYQDVIINKKTK